jgi:threonine aldolase
MGFENGLIDLRSDTVTHPTQAMRAAMANARVGDDVFGDDMTVIELEEFAAELLGYEASLFVASGSMGNLVALLTHCERGSEAIVGNLSHVFLHEQGGMAALGGIMANKIPNQPDGTLRLDDIIDAIRDDDVHHPRTRLICLENTQNSCGGVPLTPDYMRRVSDLARSRGLKVHLDGARLANAAVAQGLPLKTLTKGADSTMICLSKGLCAPIGSILAGSRDFIAEARRNRKLVGGGMRQVGVLAAPGLVALKSMIERLAEDHANAQRLAEGLRGIPGIELKTPKPQTNMVYFRLAESSNVTPAELIEQMRKRGILADLRLVTHRWINSEDVANVLTAFREIMIS